jgi:hypothetical protein
MKFWVRYSHNNEVSESIFDLNVGSSTSLSKILTAARGALDDRFGPQGPNPTHILLRVKSCSEGEVRPPSALPPPMIRRKSTKRKPTVSR